MPIAFTRPDLARAQQEGGVFNEVDVSWVNPREFHRKVISALENVGYSVPRDSNETLQLQKEIIGSKTGSVVSRIQGNRSTAHNGVVTYKSHARIGTVCIIFGLLFGIFSLASELILILAVPLIIVGIYWLFKQATSQFVILFVDVIRVLSTGEATERTVTTGGAEVTDLFAQLTVSFSGNLEVHVPIDAHYYQRNCENEDKL